ncbi:MAG: TonB-dependent receptor [Acidobacteria bacterium]|nr:TonB-dependent receptor [Acidobacteriota bacterium]
MPDAVISLVNVETGLVATTRSNEIGQYRAPKLAAGVYRLKASLAGFAPATVNDVLVEVSKVATVDIVLQVESASTAVNVTEAAPLLDTSTPQIQDTFDERAVDRNPLASTGLGVVNLSLMASGVASNGGVGVGVGPSVGGQRPRANNFMVEGVDNNDKLGTGPKVNLPIESVAEFTMLKNQFNAEFGHSSGGQFNVTVKSGSNELHGTLYEYLQNRNLNALDLMFQRQGVTKNPRYDENRFGAAVGGPIVRNKWFYFANLEYSPVGAEGTPAGDILAPTSAGYSTLASVSGVSKTNLGVLQKYLPAASAATTMVPVNGTPVAFGALSILAPNYHNAMAAVASSDYTISERDQLRGRFVYNRNSFIDTTGVSLPAFYVNNAAANYLATLAEYHTFTPYLLNELRLGYNRLNQLYGAGAFSYPGLDAFPNLTFDDIGLQLGPNPQAPQGGVQNVYQLTDNVSWLAGRHSFSFGGELRKYIAPNNYTQRSRGDYEYSTVEQFLLDTSPDVNAMRGIGNVRFYGDQVATYWHAQDSWRLRPNLTLNLGLRYEYTTIPYTTRLQSLNAGASVPGVLEFREPKAPKNAFAPRVGVAYTPGHRGSMTIRAGFGMAYDVLCDNLSILALPPQLGTLVDVSGAGTSNFLAAGGISPNMPGGPTPTADDLKAATAYYIPNNQTLPYSLQWNLGVERVFANNYTFEVRYLGTRGVHLPVQQQINRTPRVTADRNIPEYSTAPSAQTLASLPLTVGDIRAASNLLPSFAAAGFLNPITAWTPEGMSSYHGLAFDLARRFASGWQLRSSYTWSHLMDNSTSEVGSTFLTPRRAQDSQNLRPEWATSMLDRRHRIVVSAIYETPWLKHSNNWFNRNVAAGWEVAPTYVYESPEYFTVQSGVDSNLNGDSAADRAWINPGGVAHTASDVYGLDRNGNRISVSAPTAQVNQVVAWVATNPNARYVRAGIGVLPTGGRNTEPTRPINNVNLSLVKRVAIGERMRLELMGQAFNLFNHPQSVPGFVNSANSVVTAYTVGVKNYATAGNSAFGNADAAFSSNPRTLQLAAKFIW